MGNDLKNQYLRTTMVRYITSMGLTKDSLGITQLNDEDIRMIENGYTNYLFKYKWSVYPRLYQIFWEIEYYLKGGNPSGHSLTQRVEYLKNAIHVIKRHFWFGTGTGDTVSEILKQYELDNSQLALQWRKRAHNQLITFFLSFGFIGFLLFVITFSMAIYLERKNVDFLFLCFLLIFLFSTLNEDTLETQIGATYFAFFLSILLLGRNIEHVQKSDEP
jgi:4-amino-4-deoxy-L-arabinose transferase-like glycosyltransferase